MQNHLRHGYKGNDSHPSNWVQRIEAPKLAITTLINLCTGSQTTPLWNSPS